jgi:hypothetical protein
MTIGRGVFVAWLLGSLLAAVADAAPPGRAKKLPKEQVDFFEQKIRPVLVHHCYACHSGDPAKAKAHFTLDSREAMRKGGDSGPVIMPGNPSHSPLIEALKYESLEMPPKEKLPDEVIDDFVRWVEMGAPDPRTGKAANPRNKIDLVEGRKFWSFQPPKAAPAPKVRDAAWPRSDIDRFVLARLEKEGLKPVGDADPHTLVRRLYFDLTGLPPTPEEVDEFVKSFSSSKREGETAVATLVDKLLASPRFGERWGRHWLDVVRYAESTGKDRNIPYRYAWRYRDYVIDAFNQGKPFNRFIVEQIAGDLLPAKDPAEHERLVIATGFLAIGPKGVNVKETEQFRMDQVDDQIDVVTRAFLGLTVACARCHDHKFDPIPTADYYAMAGIFHSSRTYSGIAPNTKHADDDRLIKLTDAAYETKVSGEELKAYNAREREIKKLQNELADLRRQRDQGPARPAKGPAQGPGKKGKTGAPMTMADRKELREEIKDLEDKLEELENTPSPYRHFAMGMTEAEKPANCNILDRGELANKKAEVPRGLLSVLKTADTPSIPEKHSGRLQLARWIANADNPLTARVIVNRVWEHLFGQGLVDTVDNFGALGNAPSHPELLDHLAVQLVEEKWSLKRLIRAIVLSRVYQLSSDHDATNYEKDPDNRLLWRKDRRRLDAEEIRDAMLVASGQINFERPDGSDVLSLSNKTIFGVRGMSGMQSSKVVNVRSVYLPILRGYVPESLGVFDMADPNLIVGQRDVTNVPTQALYLMNNPFVLRQAEQMARRLTSQADLKPAGRVDLAFRIVLGRSPTPTEQSTALSFLQDYRQSLDGAGHKENAFLAAWTSLCQALFGAGQFRYLY